MKIFIGADHAGYELKEKLKVYLNELGLGYEVIDKGALAHDEADDYPDFILEVAKSVAEDTESFGIILGHSGQGEAMCANRIKGVRAALFYGEVLPESVADLGGEKKLDPYEIVKLSREHNDANIISLGSHFMSEDQAKFAVELFLTTEFSGDERHKRRLAKF